MNAAAVVDDVRDGNKVTVIQMRKTKTASPGPAASAESDRTMVVAVFIFPHVHSHPLIPATLSTSRDDDASAVRTGRLSS